MLTYNKEEFELDYNKRHNEKQSIIKPIIKLRKNKKHRLIVDLIITAVIFSLWIYLKLCL